VSAAQCHPITLPISARLIAPSAERLWQPVMRGQFMIYLDNDLRKLIAQLSYNDRIIVGRADQGEQL